MSSADKQLGRICKELSSEHGKLLKAGFMVVNDSLIELILLVGDKAIIDDVKGTASTLSKREWGGHSLKISCYQSDEYFSKIMSSNLQNMGEIADAKPVYDPSGFIALLKGLSKSGKLLGTQSSSREIIDRVKKRLRKVNNLKLRALVKVYRAVVDAGEAALIARDYSVPSHDRLPDALKHYFVRNHLLEKRYVKICKSVIHEFKSFEHGSLWHISASRLDKMRKDAEDFVERMRTIVR